MFPKETQILVVDDSMNIRQIICDNLRRLGYTRIESAGDANEGYGRLMNLKNEGSPVGLVLSDLNMPGPSGLDFLKQVRAQPEFSKLPFVLVTTESEKGAVIEAAVNGVSGYIVKPFNLETLTQRLKEAWKKHGHAGS
ncbi:MAG: response regulator [Pseudobdellovibrionaceae bacterium]|nr:response regulator [Bdellovibrionales bacterium]USN47146.1 MAG: response regulator [Pseudobdellovibrionaceae bacterium]